MILIALLIIVLLLTGFLIFYIVHLNRYKKFSKQGIIGPKPQFPFGNTKDSALKRRNVVYEIDDIYRTFKSKSPVVGFFLMFKPYLLATDPELIKRITIKDFKTFRNNDFNVDIVKHPVIGRSPFRLKDDVWKEKRSEITSGLTPNRLKAMYPLIIDGTKSFVDYIDQEISKNKMKVFDARDICARYTCDTISSFIFGADAQSFTSEDPFYMQMGEKLVQAVVNSVKTFLPFTMLTREVETFFIDMAQQAMKYRRETKILRDDFMSHLMNLREKTGLSETDAGANCATLFLDGFETTSLALHHALYELGKNKKVQEKLRREINENIDSDGTLPYDVMIELSYLDQVFYETLRMHTPLPFTTRVCSDDYIVTGSKDREIVIKKGTAIWVPIHSFHSDPDYFPSPEEFKPERFDFEHGGIKAFKDQFFLIPFGAGPRICLGNNFANAQVKGAIVEIVRHFEISIDKSMPDKVKIGAAEYLNVTDHKLLLNFERI